MSDATEAMEELREARNAFCEANVGCQNEEAIERLLTACETLAGAVAALESAGKEPSGAAEVCLLKDCGEPIESPPSHVSATGFCAKHAEKFCGWLRPAPEAGRSACDCGRADCPLFSEHGSGPAHQPEAKPALVTREELAEALRAWRWAQHTAVCHCARCDSTDALLAKYDAERAP